MDKCRHLSSVFQTKYLLVSGSQQAVSAILIQSASQYVENCPQKII
jgi:hypothetical protein